MSEDPIPTEMPPSAAGSSSHRRRPALRERAVEEARRFLAIFLYIWMWSILFEVHQRIILRQTGVGAVTLGFAFFNALVLAKVMLVAEDLKLGRWLRPEPLIYPILGEAFIFSVVFIVFHVVEHVVIGLFKGETVAASVPAIGGGGIAGLLSVALIYFAALVPFFGFRDVSRVLGQGRMKAILFDVSGASDQHPEHVRSTQS